MENPVTVADDAVPVVEERVVLSRVCDEVLDPGGENELGARSSCVDGVVKERGWVEDGRRA